MNIYKQAQEIRFVNEASLKAKVEKMRDSEFLTYISVLSQIHEEVKNGESVEEAVSEAAGAGYSKQLLSFINDIGLQIFSTTEFPKISLALETFRKIKEPVSPVSAPGGSNIPGVAQPEEQDFFEISDLLNMSSEERLEYFQSLSYPEAQKNIAEHMIENLKMIDQIYSAPETPDHTRDVYEKELVSAMISLNEMAQGLSEEDTEEDESPFKKKVLREIPDPNKTPKEKEEEGEKGPRKEKLNSHSSKMEREDYLNNETIFKGDSYKAFQMKSKNPYIDFTVMPPVFNEEMDSVFGRFLLEMDKVYAQSSKNRNMDQNAVKFNDMVFALKTADTLTYVELQQNMKNAPEEFMEAFKNIEHRFMNECPTQRVLKPEYFDSLFYAGLSLASGKISRMLSDPEHYDLKNEQEKNSHIQEEDFDGLRDMIEEYSKVNFKNKAEDYFRLTNRYEENNFLRKISLDSKIVVNKSVNKFYPQGPEYILKPCPTCFKWVPWSASKEAVKIKEKFLGFKVRLVSFLTNNPEEPRITIEKLKSRKWPAPKPSLYSREREQKLVLRYAAEGEKSWDQIQALLNSNNLTQHEEGWHRRTGALYEAGGVFLTTKDLLIKDIFNECPFGSSSKKNNCGISFAPTKPMVNDGMSFSLNLQPQWNGNQDVPGVDSETNLKEELWEDKNLFQRAKQKQKGGYKFSKINFACPCRISNIDSMTSYKHSNIAISKIGIAGTPGFVYPTQPNGATDTTLEDGTLAFMVCGAPTSISSFDRTPESQGYILKYLHKIKSSSPDEYQELVSLLLRNGIDVQDVMDLDAGLEIYEANTQQVKQSSFTDRMDKVLDIIKTASAGIYLNDQGLGSEKRKYLGGLTLVCPFGHKFTIEHSLKFGKANAGIYQKEGISKRYFDILTNQGEANLKVLINKNKNYLIRADDPQMAEWKKLPYEEWVNHPNGVIFPSSEDIKNENPVLMFSLPIDLSGNKIDYVFKSKKLGWKESIWPDNKSYNTPRNAAKTLMLSSNQRNTSLSSEGDDGNEIDNTAKSVYDSWQIEENNSVSAYDYNRKPGKSIPGAEDSEDDVEFTNESLDRRIQAFSRTIKATLKVINTWTKGLVSNTMMSAMFSNYRVDITGYGSEILTPMIPYLILETVDEEPMPKADQPALLEEVKMYMIEKINSKVNNLSDWIRSNIDNFEEHEGFDRQVAESIIANALMEFNHYDPDIGFDSFTGQAIFPKEGFEALAKNIAKKIVDSNSTIALELTLRTQNYSAYENRKMQYSGRVSLVAYAQYLASVLPIIYKKYCNADSPLYIGYNIGINLSSSEKILGSLKDGKWSGGLTDIEIDSITSNLEEAIQLSGMFKKLSLQSLHYAERIDRAWEELESYLVSARKQSMSNRALELSRDYVADRMSVISGENVKEVRNKIAGAFPTKSLLFSGTGTNPETGITLPTKRRLPFVSKAVPWTQMPGSRKVDEWILRNTETGKNYVFESKEKADAHLKHLKLNESKFNQNQWIVQPDPYWVNEENGYDGSKIQLGMSAPKSPSDFAWPPVPGTMDFVSLVLPFDVASKKDDPSINKAKEFPISGYRIVLDYDNKPLDISPLLRKGSGHSERYPEDLAYMIKSENFIIKAKEDMSRNIEVFKQENAKAIQNDPSILADFTSLEESNFNDLIEPHLKVIDSKGLTLKTDACYVDPTDMSRRPMIRLCLEDPLRCYKIIMNPAIRGITLTNEQQLALIDFVIRVFNLDLITDILRKQGGAYSDLYAEDLLEKAHTMSWNKITPRLTAPTFVDEDGAEKLGWKDNSGEYFSVLPGEENSDYGSYFQYVYHASFGKGVNQTLEKTQHADAKTLINASTNVKNALTKKDDDTDHTNSNLKMMMKIENEMLEYITTRTSGERTNEARDGRKKKKQKITNTENFDQRRLELERIIFSVGLQEFDDVEIT